MFKTVRDVKNVNEVSTEAIAAIVFSKIGFCKFVRFGGSVRKVLLRRRATFRIPPRRRMFYGLMPPNHKVAKERAP